MAEKEKKKAVFLAVLRSFQDKFANDPSFLGVDDQQKLKETLISFFAPDLSENQLSELKEEADFGRFLGRLIIIVEESETLVEQVTEDVFEREGVVPDKITLEELRQEMELARVEANQTRKQTEKLVEELIARFGFSQARAEEAAKDLVAWARFGDDGKKRNVKESVAAAIAVAGEKGAEAGKGGQGNVVLRAALELEVVKGSFDKFGFENLNADPIGAALEIINFPPERETRLDSLLPSEVAGEVGKAERELGSLSEEQVQAIVQADNYQEKLRVAEKVSSNASRLVALLEAKMALGRLRVLPATVVRGSVLAGIRRLVSESLGPAVSEEVPPETAREITAAAAEILASPPDWADFARRTIAGEEMVSRLPAVVRSGLKEGPARPRTVADVERAIFAAASRPATARAWLFSLEDESLDGIYRLKAFFRSPEENKRLAERIGNIISEGSSPWTTPLQHQRRLIRAVGGSFPYRWRWGMGRFFAPARTVFRALGRPVRAAGNRWGGRFFSSFGGWFSRLRQRGISWLARKAAGWGSELLAKKGLQGGLVALVEGLGLASGPPGWLVTALIFGGGVLKKMAGRMTGWLSGFNPARLIFGARRAGEEENKQTMMALAAVAIGLPILLVALILFGVATIVSSFWVSSHQTIGSGLSQSYLAAIEANKVACHSGGAPEADKACLLEEALKKCAGATGNKPPVINGGNIGKIGECLKDNGIEAAAVSELAASARGASSAFNFNLQCVGFLKAIYPQLRNISVPGAKDFIARLGEKGPLSTIAAGDALATDSGPYGHVAVVSRVIKSDRGETYVEITQADGYTGAVFTSKTTLSELRASGFVILNIK